MNVGVIGAGYVGLVTGSCLAYVGNKVKIFDINTKCISMLNKGKLHIYEKGLKKIINESSDKLEFTSDIEYFFSNLDVIFIAVGTPLKNNTLSEKYLWESAKMILNNVKKDTTIVVKSTIPVGFCNKLELFFKKNSKYNLSVIYNPEFLSEGTAVNDMLYSSRIVIGSDDKDGINKLNKIYLPLLKEPYNCSFLKMSRNSAEIIKLTSNSFLALKLTFINEIANLCTKYNANIDEVVNALSLDSRIGKEFLGAGIGFGGSCFPKDVKYMSKMSKMKTIKSVIRVNEKQNLLLSKKINSDFSKNLKNVKIGILGCTYKPKTNDIRYSPAIKNIKYLLNKGAIINVYDPKGIDNLKKILGVQERINYCDNIQNAIKDCEAAMIITAWPEIRKTPISSFVENMKSPRIYDGRNCFEIEKVKNNKVYYYSIGREAINNLEK